MVAKLHFKNNTYYCGNCRIKIFPKWDGDLPVFCPFCGLEFYNIEEMLMNRGDSDES